MAKDTQITAAGLSHDAEFYAPLNWYASYDQFRDAIILRELGPDGLPTKRERVVDSKIGGAKAMIQGPEFGQDSSGIYLYWNRVVNRGIHIRRTKVSNEGFGAIETVQMGAMMGVVSKCATANEVVMVWGPTSTKRRYYGKTPLPYPKAAGSKRVAWFPDELKFVYPAQVVRGKTALVVVDAVAKTHQIVPDTDGIAEAIAFYSPELKEHLLACMGSTGVIVVLNPDGTLIDAIDIQGWVPFNLELPEGDRLSLNKSHLVICAHTPAKTDSGIWVVELFGEPRRMDAGAESGRRGERFDAEGAVIGNKLFILYQDLKGTGRSIDTGVYIK
jgi:hypothetical protein